MTTHRHKDSRQLWTTSVTDPDLSGFATKTALSDLAARVAALEAAAAPTPTPTPTPTLTGMYGPGIGGDELANTNVAAGSLKSFARFRAEQSDALATATFYYLGPPDPGYASGTGGTGVIEVYADDGTANHFPTGPALASQPLAATARYSGEAGRKITFSNPATLVAGTLYHIVWRNTDPDPANNYFAVDYWFYRQVPNGAPGGRLTPRYPLTDWAHGYWNGSSWVLRPNFVPILDLGYANGQHQGQCYGEASYNAGQVGHISGVNQVRERITVSGSDRTISKIGLRLLRQSGSDPLTIILETLGGSRLASVDVPAASIVVGPQPFTGSGEDNIGVAAKWIAEVALPAPIVLTKGQSYALRLVTPASTTYWAWVNRRLGTPYNYTSATYFADGVAEFTTDGSTWTSLGRSANENDLQFYLA